MNKLYRVILLSFSMLLLGFLAAAQAQEIGDIIWQDHFDDPENDFLLNNVGWLYFGPDDDLVGQEVMQTEQQTALIKSGIFSIVVGASIIETNGFAYVDPEDEAGTEARFKAQNANITPNQDLTFQVNFKKMTNVPGGNYDPIGTFFICGTRMFNPDTGRGYGDPIADSTYVLWIAPLVGQVNIAKFAPEYEDDYIILDPTRWTYFSEPASYSFETNVNYRVEFYLYEGTLKAKIWEGTLEEGAFEPWLLEVTDPDPWVRGDWTEFGLLGDPLEDGDSFELDDVVMRKVTSANAIVDQNNQQPAKFALAANYPNPFNPETTIDFTLDKTTDVTLRVFSITGQLVRTLVNSNMAAGAHQVSFNGRDDLGHALASGVYFYQLQTTDNIATQKMILMK